VILRASSFGSGVSASCDRIKTKYVGRGGNNREVVETGIVRRVDELGRVVIPSELRKRLGLGERDAVEFALNGETILLSRPRAVCVFCGASDGLSEHRGRYVCTPCVGELHAA
jgi:AbrB family transcriptional regulator, transcriptional pleiotropic regulator of transition state genes